MLIRFVLIKKLNDRSVGEVSIRNNHMGAEAIIYKNEMGSKAGDQYLDLICKWH
jgi:hypothetical protein